MTSLVTPFNFGASGRLITTNDPQTIARDQIKDVLITSLNERVMRPAYGGEVAGMMFRNQGDLEAADIAQQCKIQCAAAIKVAIVTQITLQWRDSVLTAVVGFELPPSTTSFSATFQFNGYLTQESGI